MPFHSFFQNFVQDLPRLAASGPYVYVAVFLASFIESVPVIGTLMPGTILLIFFGFVAAQAHLPLGLVIFWAAIGGVVGDLIAYLIGRFGFRFLRNHRKILEHSHARSGQAFFKRHGGKSVLFARFIGLLRPIIPLIAGMLDMKAGKFLAWNAAGSFLWAGVYITLGFFFGDRLRPILKFMGRAGWVAFFIIGFVVLLYVLKEYKAKKIVDDNEDANLMEDEDIVKILDK